MAQNEVCKFIEEWIYVNLNETVKIAPENFFKDPVTLDSKELFCLMADIEEKFKIQIHQCEWAKFEKVADLIKFING